MKIKGVIVCKTDHRPHGVEGSVVLNVFEEDDPLQREAYASGIYPRCDLAYEPVELEDE